jgi:hypothetical protein
MRSHRAIVVGVLGIGLVVFAWAGVRRVFYIVQRASATFDGKCPVENDAETAFIPAANSSATYNFREPKVLFHVYTDSRRGRVSAPGTPAPRHADLLFLGCSMTFGFGVDNEQNYPSLVGRQLGVTIENLSYDGWGTLPALAALRRNSDLAPKVVIYGFVRDHIRRNASPCSTVDVMGCWRQPYLALDASGAVRFRPQQPNAWFSKSSQRYCNEVLTKAPEQRTSLHDFELASGLVLSALLDYAPAPNTTDDVDYATRIATTRYVLHELKRLSENAGAQFVLLNLPNHFAKGMAEPMCEELKQSLPPDITIIDAAPDVIKYYEDGNQEALNLDGDFYHPNLQGHRIVARKVVDALRSMHLLDKRPAIAAVGP